MKLIPLFICFALCACKESPTELLQGDQWLATSHKINGLEMMGSDDWFSNMRYHFYHDGTFHLSNTSGDHPGFYIVDDDNMKLLLMITDTIFYNIDVLTASHCHLAGMNVDLDSVRIEMHH